MNPLAIHRPFSCQTSAKPTAALAGSVALQFFAARSRGRAANRRLIELGHRRMVLIVRAARRKPTLGALERAFLEEFAVHGVVTSEFNLPNCEEPSRRISQIAATLVSSYAADRAG